MSDPRRFRAFNFVVDIGTDGGGGPHAGFQECSDLGLDVTVAEFRQGDQKDNTVQKAAPPQKTTELTLTRGLIGSEELYGWLKQAREGEPSALRSVRIELLNESHEDVTRTWRLTDAWIVKFVAGPFNAKGTDVAIEELTLGHDGLEVD
jgi:phage tail-like protein